MTPVQKIVIAEHLKPLLLKGADFFSRANITVLPAATNDDILTLHIEHRTSLIITMFGLPGLSCEELFTLLDRSRDLRPSFSIIVCEDTPGYRERSSRCPVTKVMFQPLEPGQLVRTVQELLDIVPRRSYRVILNVVVEGARKNRTFLCSSENISATGILIRSTEALGRGDRISCSFYLPDGKKAQMQGEVVRTMTEPAAKEKRYGIQFIDMDRPTRQSLESFIDQEYQRNLETGQPSGPQGRLVA